MNRAAYYGDLDQVMYLMKIGGGMGVDIEEVDPLDGWRPLQSAVMTDSEDVVSYLLTQRADTNVLSPKGLAPLHMACRDNSARLVRLLLAHNASPEAPDSEGRSAMDVCIAKGSDRARRALEGLPEEEEKKDEPVSVPAQPEACKPLQRPVAEDAPRRPPVFGGAVDPANEERETARQEAAWAKGVSVKDIPKEPEKKKKLGRRYVESDSD